MVVSLIAVWRALRQGHVLFLLRQAAKSAKSQLIRIEHLLELSSRGSESIILKRALWAEIQRKDTVFPAENQDLFLLVGHKQFRITEEGFLLL